MNWSKSHLKKVRKEMDSRYKELGLTKVSELAAISTNKKDKWYHERVWMINCKRFHSRTCSSVVGGNRT